MTTFNPFAPDTAPNLDGMSIDPGDYTTAARIFDLYAKYCTHKARAMAFRKAGEINKALLQERLAEAIYDLLPDSARW
jgi:hypothetical protein